MARPLHVSLTTDIAALSQNEMLELPHFGHASCYNEGKASQPAR